MILPLKILLCLLILSSCTSEEHVKKYAEMYGWESYKIQGYSLWGCSKDDIWHTKFTAIKNGKKISGVVCKGLLKGSTLRLD